MTIKANELKQGDKIRTEIYSTLWNRKVTTTATVMEVSEIGGNFCIMAKARDGFKEMVIDVFAAAGSELVAA